MTFSHYSGGARATCSASATPRPTAATTAIVPGTAGPGIVPRRADLYRDQLRNNDWWTYNGYIQDSFSRGRWRVNGGLRYDWQHSKFSAAACRRTSSPDLLPAQCEEATQTDVNPTRADGEIRPFGNWSPRVSVTYDLFGNGKTALKAAARTTTRRGSRWPTTSAACST